jgi:hypothetical protein
MTERSVEVPRATERSAFDRFEAMTHFVSHGLFLADLMESQAEPDRKLLKRNIEELRAAVGLEQEL